MVLRMTNLQSQSRNRRVVITGLGIISPLGCSPETLWENLTAGRSGVVAANTRPGQSIPADCMAPASEFSGEIDDFGDLEKEQKKAIRKGLKVMCRECQMGVAAAQRAVADAKLSAGGYEPGRVGVSFGSDYMLSVPEEFTEGVRQVIAQAGEFVFGRWAPDGMPHMSPLWLLKYLPNMPASHLAIYNDFRGPSNSVTMREASANLAVAEAFQVVATGRADAMLAGATGTRLHAMKSIHAALQEELAVGNGDPSGASRPFDRDRRGAVLGEGAGAVVLESLEAAQRRGARIYGEVVAGASSAAAGPHLVAHRGQALRNCLAVLLDRAGMGADRIGHVHAHGLGTRSGDAEEAAAIDAVFGERARPVPVVAAKGHFGNLGAGGGVVELVASVLALVHGRLFPVLNHENPDPACPVTVATDGNVPSGESFVNLNVTPQGQAAAVLVRRID